MIDWRTHTTHQKRFLCRKATILFLTFSSVVTIFPPGDLYFEFPHLRLATLFSSFLRFKSRLKVGSTNLFIKDNIFIEKREVLLIFDLK